MTLADLKTFFAWLMFVVAIAVIFLLVVSTKPVRGEEYMLGDSIGVGIAQAGHMKSLARVGAPASAVMGQLKNVPDGSTVFISAGTNDAVAGRTQFAVRPIFDYADAHSIDVTWIGPPCVKRNWNAKVHEVDRFLWTEVPADHYVSLYEPAVCSLSRARDGVHFTGNGYLKLYIFIKGASGALRHHPN